MQRVALIPLLLGILLWAGATALLIEDAWHQGQIGTQHLLAPLLTLATASAGILCHRRLGSLRTWPSALAFAVVAALGSILVVYSTTGRTAATSDRRQAETRSELQTQSHKLRELQEAKAGAAKECVRAGDRCKWWTSRVDGLTEELASMSPGSVDPRADSIAKLATIVGFDGEKTKAIVSAVDPWALPVWLEIASIVFLSAAFPKRRKSVPLQSVASNGEATISTDATLPLNVTVAQPVLTIDEALTDLLKLKTSNSQQFLSDRWGWDKATVSRQLREWEGLGIISRQRRGKAKQVLALPPPR
jgi:hypothetical protein